MLRRPGGIIALTLACALSACAHLLPASWKAFDISPSFARPAVITAMKEKQLPLLKDNPGETEIQTEWVYRPEGPTKMRERFRVWWEFDEDDKLLIVYVRNEQQSEEYDGFNRKWGSTSHDASAERALLKEIEEALITLHKAVQ